MRKSFNGLYLLIMDQFPTQELPGKMFIFTNKRKDRVKVYYWDNDGFAIWYKLLEKGTFIFPQNDQKYFELSAEILTQIFSGFDVDNLKKQKRFSLKMV